MKKRLMALLLSGVLAVSMFAGCSSEIDKTAVVATNGTTDITLGVANFAARLTQAQYDDFYVSYFGENVWRTDMYGYGTTTADDMKATVLENLYAMYALKDHMADYGVEITLEEFEDINAVASEFLGSNSIEAIEALGADQESVATYLELLTIQSRMYNEIIKDTDTNVSDEEAATSAYSQVYISKTSYTDEEGNSVKYTEEELAGLAQNVKAFAESAKVNGLEAAADAYGYKVTTATYNKDSSVVAEVETALKALTTDGAVSDLIELENAYYVVQMDAVVDADATEATRESIISNRQSELYTKVVEDYVAESEWKLDKKLWEKVTFDNLFTLYEPETETEVLEATEE
ncbi:MAG: peptidyl-prolyl cis-trans isomerase [Lachnospiraceae bacterium]|nr:peptidyl-prolyl cis-trans isomerase [Lachnospiraceae bacterium]